MKNFDEKKYREKIIIRAMKDPDFRNELKKNLKAIVEKELGFSFAPELSIQMIEQPANKWVIVVPVISNVDSLSEVELSTIAGGRPSVIAVGRHC